MFRLSTKTFQSNKTDSKDFNTVKALIPALIVSFVFSFMLFLYEPIVMYSANINDFWFDLGILLPQALKMTALFFAACLGVLALIWFISRNISEKILAYRIALAAVFVLFAALYIQGTFLSGELPALDGSEINWNIYGTENIVIIAVLIVLMTAAIIGMYNLKPSIVYKIIGGVSAAIFVMLLVSMVQAVVSNKAAEEKKTFVATDYGFNTASVNKNFYIFLLDAVESREFGNIIESDEKYKEVFEDFTYFPDTVGGYPCTRDTIPLILSGELNKNEEEFGDFSTKAYNNSHFFAELTERNYELNLFDADMIWFGDKTYTPNNWTSEKRPHINFGNYMSEELKYAGYKYLPYILKRFSGIETMDFNSIVDKFRWNDPDIYGKIIEEPKLSLDNNNMFQFIHSEGAHIPFRYDENLNYIESGTYSEKIKGCITMADAFLKRLKENGVYDNSVIIFMADHGNTDLNSAEDMFRRANPLFMVKGIGEKHDYAVSESPVSYLELMDAYSDLLDGKPAGDLFTDLDPSRPRTFMWYRNFGREDHMVEYQTTSKAWEWDKFVETGNVYDLAE